MPSKRKSNKENEKKDHEKKTPEIKKIKTKDKIKREFTQEEKIELSNSLARILGEKTAKELEKQKAVSQFNAEIKNILEKINDFVTKIRDGFEMVLGDVEIEINYKEKTKKVTRLDTKEVLRVEDLSDEECQMTI